MPGISNSGHGTQMQIVPVFSPASAQARAIVDLFYIVLVICGLLLVVVLGLIGWSLYRFRGKPESPEPRQIAGNTSVEVAWTVIPFLLVVFLFVLTARAMNQSDPVPAQLDPDLVITAHQWWWEARYSKTGAVTANEIHIPVGQRWLVQLKAADVIHDFWAPRLGRKMDMVPGHPNYLWLQSDRVDTFEGACAEYCGTQHAWMRFKVIAQAPSDFEKWIKEQTGPAPQPRAGSAEQGAILFAQLTCANCHDVKAGSGKPELAPDLVHLAERRTLAAGVLENTPSNLFRWIKNPQVIKPGSLMPNLHLSDEQAQELTDYLEPTQ